MPQDDKPPGDGHPPRAQSIYRQIARTKDPRWGGRPVNGRLPFFIKPTHNNFMAISTFSPGADGKVYRRKSRYAACHVLMVDDVGTKVPEHKLALDPSYLLETSPENFQAGYLLIEPVADRDRVERVLNTMVVQGLAVEGKDPGMKGVTRYGRLPVGRNTKAKYIERLGAPFVQRLRTWDPERRYRLEDLIEAYALDLDAVRGAPSVDPGDDRILQALEARGLVKAPLEGKPGAWDITCPWADEHTDRADSGTAYFQAGHNGYTAPGFKCHHGHCESRTIRDLLAFLKPPQEEHGKAGNIIPIRPVDALPLPLARTFIDVRFQHADGRTLHHHAGEFLAWDGRAYHVLEDGTVRADLYRFMERIRIRTEEGLQHHLPTAKRINDLADALRAEAHLQARLYAVPCWLSESVSYPARELIALGNGLLHLPSGALLSHTPALLNTTGTAIEYDPNAGQPSQWLAFLRELWADDEQAIETLQDFFGYALTSDTRQQKIFLIVGPKRSGKGTIARILTALLGAVNVAGPTLASLGTNFGLQPLIGKSLAIISDARLGGRADVHVVVERLLAISGEDAITIDRKYHHQWTGYLPTRFLLLTNELPKLTDASGALASRFIILTLTKSFYGHEDHGLTERLKGDLPGILNWAIAGWRRLQARGHFVQPSSSKQAVRTLEDLASPINAFIRERCVAGPGQTVPVDDLFKE
jgi:P4 family phage/plasmid primase-like protien